MLTFLKLCQPFPNLIYIFNENKELFFCDVLFPLLVTSPSELESTTQNPSEFINKSQDLLEKNVILIVH